MKNDIQGRKDSLRKLIPKTKSGAPKTDRLEKLDSMLYSRKFSMEELDFVEKEILSSVEFFEARKKLAGEKENES